MKAGKIIIYILLGLFTLVFITAALVPRQMKAEQTVVINHSPETVFPYLASHEHMMEWNPWSDMDREAKNTLEGEPMAVGSKWRWQGEKLGKGYLEIEEIVPNKKVVSTLKFTEPSQSAATDIRLIEEVPEGSKVTWTNKSELSYPFERLVGFFMEGVMQNNLKKGLNNLKEYVNQKTQEKPMVVILDIEGMTCTGCENTIEKSLRKLPGTMSVEASHEEAQAVLKVDSARFNYEDYKKAIEDVGYKSLGVK